MSLYQSKEKIIDTTRFNLEACETIHQKIDNSTKEKIIVTGERYSGKTTTLSSYAKTTINNKNQAIYIETNKYNYEPYLTDRELKYKYELLIALNLIDHIKNNYNKLYHQKYKNIEISLLKELKRFNIYTKNIFTNNKEKQTIYYSKEKILYPLINNIKRDLEIDKLTLILDSFDWVGNSSIRYQVMMKKYLELFDRYIITTDDISLRNNKDKQVLKKNKGYDIIKVDYGLNYKITKDIISKDINYWKKNKRLINNKLNINFVDLKDIISDKTYNKLIDNSNGDINSIFEALKTYYEYSYINFIDIDNSIIKFQDDYIKLKNEIETKMKIKKLHI